MPDNPFEGATQDPVGLLGQLIGKVAEIGRDLHAFRQDMSEFKQEMTVFKD